jgi:DNA-binding NarL/FixJ family response regulator
MVNIFANVEAKTFEEKTFEEKLLKNRPVEMKLTFMGLDTTSKLCQISLNFAVEWATASKLKLWDRAVVARKGAAVFARDCLTGRSLPTREGRAIQTHVVGYSPSARLTPMLANSHVRVVRHRFNEPYRQSASITYRVSVRKAMISMAIIDEKSFTRECITRSLQALDDRLDIMSFATCEDCLQSTGSHDLILYHAHEAVVNWCADNQQLSSFKKLLKIVPVIILSDVDCPDSVSEVFESGARGFIPTANTTLEQIIEIIGLVKVGGIFVPPSSLLLRRIKGQGVTDRAMTSHQFTPSEVAVLDRLKLGEANKIIAHALGVSESTVKVHIGRIMKKLKVTNRTQVVCRAYALAATGVRV